MFDWLARSLGWSGRGGRARRSWLNDYSGAQAEPDPKFGPYFEARDWLRASVHPAPLAPNRFPAREDAEAFVARLYGIGALRVLVGETSEASDGSGRRASLLVAEVPFDLSRVGAFLALWEAEFGRMDDYQASSTLLYFWWD